MENPEASVLAKAFCVVYIVSGLKPAPIEYNRINMEELAYCLLLIAYCLLLIAYCQDSWFGLSIGIVIKQKKSHTLLYETF